MTRAAVVCGLAFCLFAATAAAETPGTVTEYQLPAGAAPQAVAFGPGGLWLTLRGLNAVGLMTTAGGLRTFPIPTANSGAAEITPGPDGNVWFTEPTASRIGRVTVNGVITEFATPTPASLPTGITAGPDGAVWFTEARTPARVGRITAAGVISEFPVPGNEALNIINGPDPHLWYTAPNGDRIGQINPSTGVATEFFAPGNPTSLALADNTSLWYTQQTGNAVGRITTAGTTVTGVTTDNSSDAIVHADDGSAWFTLANGKVGNITTASAAATEFPTPAALPDQPAGITQGPDHAIWVPEPSSGRIARIGTSASSAAIPPPVTGATMGGSTISGVVRVRLPGSKTFVTLGAGRDLPVGTIVDARSGTIELTATSGGVAYAAQFFEGQFQLAQRRKKDATADLKLFGGSFRGCPRGVREAANPKKSVRHLWGDGSGKFRTVGRFSAAAVRGTKWLTDDLCGGTLTRVTSGSVTVRDFVRRKTVVVRAGKRYLARAPG